MKSTRSSKGDKLVLSFLSVFVCVVVEMFPGKQFFQRSRDWAEDESLEEGGTSVDVTQFERTHQSDEENEGDRVYFSDSD